MPYSPTPGTRPEDLNPNAIQPIVAGGRVSQEEFETVYERPIPEQMWLFSRHANYVGFASLLRMMGFAVPSSNPTIGHFEAPWIHDLLHVGGIVTPAANPGESTVVSIDPSAHYDTGVTVGGAAREATYPVVGDVIELPNRVQVQVTDKDTSVIPNQVTLTPLKAADDITGEIAEDDKLPIFTNLHAESSGLPAGRAKRIMKYGNTFGLVKHSFGATGFELTNSVYHETIPGQPGSAGESSYLMIKTDELVRYEHSKSNLLLFGQQADNLTDTTTESGIDMPIYGTEGFVEFASTSGTPDGYTVGSYDITDFDVVANILLDERSAASNDVIGWLGPDLFTEIENSFTTTLEQNLMHTVDRIVDGYSGYANEMYQQGLTSDPSDATLSFGYSAIRKNGFVFHMKRLSEFNDIRRGGAAGSSYRNWGIWYPMSWTRDTLSGEDRPTIGYQYKALNEYSRENVFGSLPGAGVGGDNTPFGAAVTEYDTMRYFLMSHLAFHGAVGNALVVQQPA